MKEAVQKDEPEKSGQRKLQQTQDGIMLPERGFEWTRENRFEKN